MNLAFDNKVAVVTGAGSGMDLATGRGFAEARAAQIGKPAVVVFDSKSYDRDYFIRASGVDKLDLRFHEFRLKPETAFAADGAQAVCVASNDVVNREVLERLAGSGARLVSLRCAGFNNVDLDAAKELGVAVTRVPSYSPHAVAEHTIALILALNRKIHRASNRVRKLNFSLSGLVGFDLSGKTAGFLGTGKIGSIVAEILCGSGHVGGVALDVYEEEEGIFFEDLSGEILQDDELARLLTFPNVLVTAHQAFLTHEALSEIARITVENVRRFVSKQPYSKEPLSNAPSRIRYTGSRMIEFCSATLT